MTEVIRQVTIDEFTFFDRAYNHKDSDDPVSRSMLTQSRSVVVHWCNPCFGLFADGELVSVNVTSWSKRPRKNGWGRYGNFYLAYTRPTDRFKGFATRLALHLESIAVQNGYSRLKSLAGSYAGVRLHMGMGHHFWGVGKGGALIVDTPITTEAFPEGVPIETRNAGEKAGSGTMLRKMDVEDLRLAVSFPPFSATIEGITLARYSIKRR